MPSDTFTKTLTFTDKNGDGYVPDTVEIIFYDPDGTQSGDALDIDDLTAEEETGVYTLKWDMPADADAGLWSYKVTATYVTSDLTNEETFSFWVYSATQAKPIFYGDIDQVKRHLRLDPTDTTHDLAIFESGMKPAAVRINNALRNYVTVPLSEPTQDIEVIANLMAAGMLTDGTLPEEQSNRLLALADKMLNEYIAQNHASLPIVIGETD
jgi:hypothetical protein